MGCLTLSTVSPITVELDTGWKEERGGEATLYPEEGGNAVGGRGWGVGRGAIGPGG